MADDRTERIIGAAIEVHHGQRIDEIAFEEVVVEIKSVRALPDIATAQVLSYLRATNLKRALLINFGVYRLSHGIKRISL
jgi:GxxExxY protein